MPWGNGQWWIYSNTPKRLPLKITDCHSKSDFDRELSSAQCEGRGTIWCTLLNPGYKNSFSKANNSCCYGLLVHAAYDHVLPPPEAKVG
jgi:hypothetical protein